MDHNAPCLSPKILHNHGFQFLQWLCIFFFFGNGAGGGGGNKLPYGLW